MRTQDARVARLIGFFEGMSPADLGRLEHVYAAQARFKDPFSEAHGLGEVARVYARMFETLHEPRFTVRDVLVDADRCFLTWDFSFRLRRFLRDPQVIHGGSLLRFDADGLIVDHCDYWDAAGELYEKLPGLGVIMRWLRQRASA